MAEDFNRSAGVIRSTEEYLSETSPDKNTVRDLTTLSSSGDDDSDNIRRDSPRAIRNRAEKLRRDNLNKSISSLGAMLPAVLAANKKMDKTGILRLTAHYLRSQHYVFGDIFSGNMRNFSDQSAQTLLRALNGFIITTTYKGIVVVVSEQVNKYLGYSEVELLGRNVLNIVHVDDQEMMLHQLVPTCVKFGAHGELLLSDEPDSVNTVQEMLAKEHRNFFVRFIKQTGRSGPRQYQLCHVRGSFRKSDRACSTAARCCQMTCRLRNRGETFTPSGNDVVFIGFVQPMSESFMRERHLESFKLEYRTRHSIDGEILQSEHRISMVTGYLTNEVVGVNAMNFMHKDDVRWVIIALREMYDKHRLMGESCYRLMTKAGDFVFMKTRGQLEVEQLSGAVSTFVCVNTVVEEVEGAALIQKMKRKYSLMVGRCDSVQDNTIQDSNISMPAVEHPDRLKKVIIHLVSELPYGVDNEEISKDRPGGARRPLAIIPREPEVIVNAIDRSYEVIPHRASIQNCSHLPKDHNEPTPGLSEIKTDSAGNSVQSSQVCESNSDSQTILLNSGSDDDDQTTNDDTSDISQPSAQEPISDTDSTKIQSKKLTVKSHNLKTPEVYEVNSEIQITAINLNTNTNNIVTNNGKPSLFIQPTPTPSIQINTVNGKHLQTIQINEPKLTNPGHNLNYGEISIDELRDISHLKCESIGINITKLEMSIDDNSQMCQDNEPKLTLSEFSYDPNYDIAAIAGPSGIFFTEPKTDSDVEKLSADIVDNDKHLEASKQYDLSSEAHVSLSTRDQLLGEVQNRGSSPPCLEGAASSSMKRASSCDGNDENSKKFCDESQLPYNDGVDYYSEQFDSEHLVEGLLLSPRMQTIFDNAWNTMHECILNDPFVDDSWWDDSQQNMPPSLQDDKK